MPVYVRALREPGSRGKWHLAPTDLHVPVPRTVCGRRRSSLGWDEVHRLSLRPADVCGNCVRATP